MITHPKLTNHLLLKFCLDVKKELCQTQVLKQNTLKGPRIWLLLSYQHWLERAMEENHNTTLLPTPNLWMIPWLMVLIARGPEAPEWLNYLHLQPSQNYPTATNPVLVECSGMKLDWILNSYVQQWSRLAPDVFLAIFWMVLPLPTSYNSATALGPKSPSWLLA